MLYEHGIFAISPELGTSDNRTNTFFIEDPAVLEDVLQQNNEWISFAMNKLLVHLSIEFVSSEQISDAGTLIYKL